MELTRTSQEQQILQVGIESPAALAAAPGIEEMFCEVYRQVHDPALAQAELLLSSSEAEDAVGNAVAKAWRLWPTLRPEQQCAAYLYRAVHHEVVSRLRENERFVDAEDAEAALAGLAIEAIDASEPSERARFVDRVIDVMPQRRREVFLLVRELGYSYKEAAEVLGMSEGTVNTHMRLATNDLRAALQRSGLTLASGSKRMLPAPSTPKEGSDV